MEGNESAAVVLNRLRQDLEIGHWVDLRPYFVRDGLILISLDVNIVEVGVAVACDHVEKVSKWLLQKRIHKPTLQEIMLWDRAPLRYEFAYLILDPYVLAQRIVKAPSPD